MCALYKKGLGNYIRSAILTQLIMCSLYKKGLGNYIRSAILTQLSLALKACVHRLSQEHGQEA